MERNALIISIQNAKGGVGKTTISTNISHILSCAGCLVLHIDLDPQGSSSELIRPYFEDGRPLTKDDIIALNITELLTRPVDTRKFIFKTKYENLDIIPYARSASDIYQNGSMDKRIERLEYPNKYLSFSNNLNMIRGDYDFIIIDGLPSMEDTMKVSILASDYVLSPANPDRFNLQTIDDTCNIIDLCNKEYHRETEYLGFFLNAVDDVRDSAYQEVRDFYIDKAKEYFIDNPVRSSKAVDKSALNDKLWLDYGLTNTVTLPNPVKDLLRLLYKELELLTDDQKQTLIELGIKKECFE